MSWHETSWWWPTKSAESAESAVIRRLDDHLRRINFYEPVLCWSRGGGPKIYKLCS